MAVAVAVGNDEDAGDLGVRPRALRADLIRVNHQPVDACSQKNAQVVTGRRNPANRGRFKTSHFETREICCLRFVLFRKKERTVRWRINSIWRTYRRYCHFTGSTGRPGGSPGELNIDRETVGHYLQLAAADGSKPAKAPTGSEGACGVAEASAQTAASVEPGGRADSKPASAPTGSPSAFAGGSDSKPAKAPTGSQEVIPAGRSVAWPWRGVIIQKLEQGLDAQR
ncbi:MAG: hypothetical protein ABSH20_23035, partial [Tepidisphaeraceae bacterium]